MGQAIRGVEESEGKIPEIIVARRIVANEIVVVDGKGNTCASLGSKRGAKDAGSFHIYDKHGNPKVNIGIDERGNPLVTLASNRGEMTISMAVVEGDSAVLTFALGTQNRMTMTMNGQGEVAMGMYGPDQKLRIEAAVHENGVAVLDIMGEDEKPRLEVGVAEKSVPYVIMNDGEEKPRIVLDLGENDEPLVAICQKDGTTCASMKMFEGRPAFALYSDVTGQAALELMLEEDDNPVLSMYDNGSRRRIQIGMDSEGKPMARACDRKGEPVECLMKYSVGHGCEKDGYTGE